MNRKVLLKAKDASSICCVLESLVHSVVEKNDKCAENAPRIHASILGNLKEFRGSRAPKQSFSIQRRRNLLIQPFEDPSLTSRST